jgi:hypothetical protein
MKRLVMSLSMIIFLGVTLLQAQYNEDFSGEIYKKYKGQILFSSKEIDLNTYSEKDIQNSFEVLDEIYAQVLLDKTLAESYKDNEYTYDFDDNRYTYNYALRLTVDNEKKEEWLFELSEKYFQYALTFDLVLSSNDQEEKRNNSVFVNDWVSIITTLKEGKRKIQLDIIPFNIDLAGATHPVLASGSFTLNIVKDKMNTYLKQRTTDFPPVTMVNESIEQEILKASKDVYPYTTSLKALITDIEGDWSYATDESGYILSRQITASVIYHVNTSNQCWVKTGIYYQKHQGFGKFTPMQHFRETLGYYDYQIPCWKVK